VTPTNYAKKNTKRDSTATQLFVSVYMHKLTFMSMHKGVN